MTDQIRQFIETVSPQTLLRVERELGDGFVVLKRDEAERRQAAQDVRCSEDIVIELLRNARDAGATKIFLATTLEGETRNIVVLDNGCGIPAYLHELVFEPRVTSKLDTVHMDKWGIHGRGMALYSVRENCSTARICASAPGLGTSIATSSSVRRLPEKSDQSSFPTFTLDSDGKVKIGGPKNILRTASEFAMEHRGQVSVFVGSYSEIAAALVQSGLANYSLAELSLLPDSETVPFIDRPAFSHSPLDLAEILKDLGLELSSRTARRILDGQIQPAEPLHEIIRAKLSESVPAASLQARKGKRRKSKTTLRFAPDDLQTMAATVAEGFKPLADKYYLNGDVQPQVAVKHGRMVLTLPLITREQ